MQEPDGVRLGKLRVTSRWLVLACLGLVACDDDHTGGVERAPRSQGVVQQGGGCDMVQDLGQLGIHPRAHARSQNDQ